MCRYEIFPTLGNKLYTTHINAVVQYGEKPLVFTITAEAVDEFKHRHMRLGQPGNTMLQKMIKNQVNY